MSGDSLNDGRYELEPFPLAPGGMSSVWRGRDTKLDRAVVVKFVELPPGIQDGEHIRQRFDRESRITARLEHPGVPAIYDVGEHEGRPFIVMQYVRGLTVEQLIDEHSPVPIGWVAAIGAQICSVLAVAHAESLIHRDLKPRNLILERHGAVKVLDFGLAVAPTLADFSRITRTGDYLGTPAYMAPEQVETNLSGPATDLYALGCTLHEMLTGVHVFDGKTPFQVMTQQVRDTPPPVRALRPEVPADLEKLILELLEKRPEARPSDAGVVYRRLLPFVGQPPPLTGVVDPGSVDHRMYAAVLSRIQPIVQLPAPIEKAATAPDDSPVQTPTTAGERAVVTREDLRRARIAATALARQSRFQQAAEALQNVERRARKDFGRTDDDVLAVRHELAGTLFDGGNYRRAAPLYHALAGDLAGRGMADILFDCRVKEATCYAYMGQVGQAIEQLDALLADQQRTLGQADDRTLEIRKQIGLLQLESGRRGAARRTLEALLNDIKLMASTDLGESEEVAGLLDAMRTEDSPVIDSGWAEVLRLIDRDETGVRKLALGLARRGLPTPIVGFEVGEEAWNAELAWPTRRVAVLASGDNLEAERRDTAFAAARWEARESSRWTVDELAQMLLILD